ncbi:MAG: type II toxin-antitoxin system death-on-curing family toxin [Phycisphaerae bacterium]|nr:type II toxin-antitoxin system death-on-curing family toxin [Phycisphaerae bacterium]
MMRYLTYDELIALHVVLVRGKMQETYYGVRDEGLLRSALARPQNAAHYENADATKQAAYLFHGLLMNHGFAQGNKRTAYLAMEWFLARNSLGALAASDEEIIAMVYAAEREKWSVERMEGWLREHIADERSAE